MAAPQPKILTAFDVPTGGWGLRLQISDVAPFDTTVDVTLDAGTYYMAWDGQDDCFLELLHSEIYAALEASGVGDYVTGDNEGKPVFWLDSDHKTNVVWGGFDIRFVWGALDGPDIANVLGFDSSSSTSLTTSTPATGTWHHAYGWYADDYLLEQHQPEDHNIPHVLQSRALDGKARTIYLDSWDINAIELAKVPRVKMYSRRVGYGEASVHPYARNAPLQCWWNEARQGIQFRFYPQESYSTALAAETGVTTGTTTTTLTDGGKTWETDPHVHTGRIVQKTFVDGNGLHTNINLRWLVSSHTATVLTLPNDVHNTAPGNGAYYIFDHTYGTYTLDQRKMREFAPREIPNIDKYDLVIPVVRYIA